MAGHGFFQVLDRHGRRWRHGRASWWSNMDDGRRGVNVGLEWSHLPERPLRRLRLKVSTTGEETLDVAYGLVLLNHYWSLDLTRRTGRLVRLPGIRFDVSLGLTGCSWCLGHDPMSWATAAPLLERLRRNDLTWWRVSRYRRSVETVVAGVEAEVLLPEGPAPVVLSLERSVWGMRVGPYRRSRRSRRRLAFWLPGFRKVLWHAEVESKAGLPVPGKGENSWDCGPDAIFSLHTPVGGVDTDGGSRTAPYGREWVGQALAAAQASVYRDRTRYGSGIADTGR